ncbi:sulfatase-like hydrolase/transferase [Cellvibrio sp. OA-2007]|uniref:sulfatase-like hydrolase/transferase n=1 Tax=Cellvibrio sp. OA-2007 TaxID=529823 RepID=UPI000A076DD4|nr:sulfatase-like hydrolase/transferase [Cellvibrio sp. OA-2007]
MRYVYLIVASTLLISCGGGGAASAPLPTSSALVSSSSIASSVSSGMISSVQQNSSNASVAETKTNVLLIIADDLGLDASNQYSLSQQRPATPTLDGLAAQGIVFDNVWATPACTTTRGSIITGQHGINSGISFVPAILDPQSQTLQRYLRNQSASANYKTAVIGKWHLGGSSPVNSHPTDSGVDYYSGNITGVLPDYFNWPLISNGISTTSTEYHSTKVTDLAINWLAQQQQPDPLRQLRTVH